MARVFVGRCCQRLLSWGPSDAETKAEHHLLANNRGAEPAIAQENVAEIGGGVRSGWHQPEDGAELFAISERFAPPVTSARQASEIA